ncbi:MAG: family 20 glycosylhydrolase [Roseburia sp.]|nr:family 20 glycosylhydrolase [Roseburia sp.]
MDFNTCPRLKKASKFSGEYRLDMFKVFTVGQGELFMRSLKIFLPQAEIKPVPREDANIVITVSYAYSSENEYCYIRITDCGIEIHCRDNAGARNAAAIIAQIIRTQENGGFVLPCGVAEDWPDAQYRAMMLESSGRVWMPMNIIRRYIQEMALCRMNVLQFHFMEDSGCTVPFDSAPELSGYGKENLKFTKDEVREMIAYAADLGIRVTPFVEVLSHATDFAEKSGIGCPGDGGESMYDVCLGQEKTFEVIEKILTEISELFPDDVIHIGADEYDMCRVTPWKPYWEKCPHCQELSRRMGYTSLRELFLYGIERINRIVNKLGKVMMMWNADIHPGHLPKEFERNMIIHYYRFCSDLGRERIYNLYLNGYIEDGFSAINSYYPQTYMDFDNYMSAEKLNGWSHLTGPLVKKENHAKLPGGCCCAWEEHEHYCRTIPAAIMLFADRLWNAYGDPVPYDEAYGRTMTHILFGTKLPEDMNVFACLGGVLPPLKDNVAAHVERVEVGMDELIRVKNMLRQLTSEGDETAEIYADAIEKVISEKLNEEQITESLKVPLPFEG